MGWDIGVPILIAGGLIACAVLWVGILICEAIGRIND